MIISRSTIIKSIYLSRHFSQCRQLTSYQVRNRFLDYFIKEHTHAYIRSSPVVPLHDHSLAFVNAGMNQFKEVFLDNVKTPYKRAANSQKCIRVGGKHNDLKDVGLDTYHHTFFEMLGNWSFGDYFKHEACKLAWTLLTTPPYSIDPKRLYVTYFCGCNELGLPPDLETKEIWSSLGIDSDHILPFGVKENFWEMGSTGPCGSCTEIHVDLLNRGQKAVNLVNQGYSDVTELWNIVFIQYNRNEDGSLSPLPCHHVDTGMGFERLVALLQNKTSNYDTDLFMPLFDTIARVSRAPGYGSADSLDIAYRVLADHSRMVSVAISDNIFPDSNHKLRRVLRRALLVAEDSFKMKMAAQLVKEVCSRASDTLSGTYPELGKNLDKVRLLVDHEWEVLVALRSDTSAAWQQLVAQDARLTQLATCVAPGLCDAYRELMASNSSPGSTISADQTWRLYDTHGLPLDTIDELCQALGIEFNEDEFNTKLAEAKARSLLPSLLLRTEAISKKCLEELKRTTPITDDSAKYNYTRNEDDGKVTYIFPEVQCTVLAVVQGGEISGEVEVGERVGLILDHTCLYHEAGGQVDDRGVVEGEGWRLECDSVVNCTGYIVHLGTLTSSSGTVPSVGAGARVRLDETRRLALMRHHTTTHLVHSALRCLFPATYQRGSLVSEQLLTFDFATYGQTVTDMHIKEVERRVKEVIAESVPVSCITVGSNELAAMDDVTLLPGETYPTHGVHLVNIQANQLTSKEACCGTHVLNTRDLEGVCVVGVSNAGSRACSLTVVAGLAAAQARHRAITLSQQLAEVCQRVGQTADYKFAELESDLKKLRKEIANAVIPYDTRTEALSWLDSAAKLLKESARGQLKLSMEEEMRAVLQSLGERRFLVHGLQSTMGLGASLQLQKVTRLCPADLPVVIVGYSAGQLKARCVMPQEKVSSTVSAQAWLEPVLAAVGGQGGAPRGQDPCLIYNMKPLRVPHADAEKLIQQALQVANSVANKLFNS